MKNVNSAYDLRFSPAFLATMAVQAEFIVPNPQARHIAQMNTVTSQGTIAIRKIPIL